MSRMFGDRIREFVLSIDIMDEEAFTGLLELIHKYVYRQLDVTYFSVLEETTIDNRPGLRTLWSTRDERLAYTVDKEGGYSSHSAFTFGDNRPLWVVSESRETLQKADDLKELWTPETEEMPAYNSAGDQEVRTSVMHPLRRGSRPIGMIEFGCPVPIEPTPASKQEVGTLAETVARAYRMFDVRKTQSLNTERALRLLEASLTEESWKRLALPQVFVAYSGRGDDDVVDTIRDVVEGFGSVIAPHFWEDNTESGNINSQVVAAITNSEFGICYFSEPLDDNYDDNSNMLFEAGMMQALTNSGGALLRGWIPIREDSDAMPFDVAAERMVIVPRTADGLDKDEFATLLKQRIATLVGLTTEAAEG